MLVFSPGRRSQTFRAVALILTSSPVLRTSGLVKTWSLPFAIPGLDGQLDPVEFLEPPTADACNWIRLSNIGGPIRMADERAFNLDGSVRIELATAGVDETKLLDLWEAIEESLFPGAASPVSDDMQSTIWDHSVDDLGQPGAKVPGFGAFRFQVRDASQIPAQAPAQRSGTPGFTYGVGIFDYTIYKNEAQQ